jgi:hypothetical protein
MAHGKIRSGCRDLERPRRGLLRQVRADERAARGSDLRELRLVDRHVGREDRDARDAPSARIRSAAIWAIVNMAALYLVRRRAHVLREGHETVKSVGLDVGSHLLVDERRRWGRELVSCTP